MELSCKKCIYAKLYRFRSIHCTLCVVSALQVTVSMYENARDWGLVESRSSCLGFGTRLNKVGRLSVVVLSLLKFQRFACSKISGGQN